MMVHIEQYKIIVMSNDNIAQNNIREKIEQFENKLNEEHSAKRLRKARVTITEC